MLTNITVQHTTQLIMNSKLFIYTAWSPLLLFLFGCTVSAQVQPTGKTDDLVLTDGQVTYMQDLDVLVFEQTVRGIAGNTIPEAAGQMNEAPVWGYVFPTTLRSSDVGFNEVEGGVALAVTSHPDFDDTPLWDENRNSNYEDDGSVFHTHWVVLGEDARVPGGLSVIEFKTEDMAQVLPPTAPGMPMYLDSPGHSIVLHRNKLRVIVPRSRVNGQHTFNFDAVTAYMEVNTADPNRPLLGVYEVYSVLSGDLSLPFSVSSQH